MATVDKDFKVKQGLNVTLGGTFGGTVTVATPTSGSHATTKTYVDSIEFLVDTASSPPADAVNGQLYVDTTENRLLFYYNGQWNTLALLQDTIDIAQHIHDTAIGGTGLIVSTFVDAGFYNTNSWSATYDGGIATEVYN